MKEKSLAIVAGAGAGLGQALLARFAAEGMQAVGLVRTAPASCNSVYDLRVCDTSDKAAVDNTVRELIALYGSPTIVVHNPAHLVIKPFLAMTPDEFEQCWSSMVYSAIHLGQAVLPAMEKAGVGTLIMSGATASLRGGKHFAAFASAKFALRGLTQSLAREFQPAGIHVVHTILDGIIDTQRSRELHSLDPANMMRPEDIADIYWSLAQQPRSTWTHELDIRPQTESF